MNIANASYETYNSLVDDDDWDLMTGNQLGITREKAEDLMVRAFQSYCTKLSIFVCDLNSIKGMLTVTV